MESISQTLRTELDRVSVEGKDVAVSLQETRADLEKTTKKLRDALGTEGTSKLASAASEERKRQAEERVKVLQEEIETREREKTDLEAKLEAEKKRTHTLRGVLGRTVTDLETSRGHHETTKDSLRTAERNAEIAKQREDTLLRKISSLETSSATLKTQLGAAKGKQSALDRQVGRYVADIGRLKQDLEGRDLRVRGLEGEAKLLHADVDRLGESLKEEQNRKDQARAAINKLQHDLANANRTNSDLQLKVSSLQTETSSMADKLAAFHDDEVERDRQLAAYVLDVGRLERDCAGKGLRIEDLEGEVRRLTAQVVHVSDNMKEEQMRKEEAVIEAHETRQQHGRLTQDAEELRNKVSSLVSCSAAMANEIAELRHERESHDLQLVKYVADARRQEQDLMGRESKIGNLEEEVARLKADVDKAEECLAHERAEKERAHAQISNLAEQLAHAIAFSSSPPDYQAVPSHLASTDLVSIRTQLAFALEDAASSTFDARSLQKWLYQEICRVEHLKAKMIDKEQEVDGMKKERAELVDKVAKLELDRKRVGDEAAELHVEQSTTDTLREEGTDLAERAQVDVLKTEVDKLRSQEQPVADDLLRNQTFVTLPDGYFPPRSVRNATTKVKCTTQRLSLTVSSESCSKAHSMDGMRIFGVAKRVFDKPAGQQTAAQLSYVRPMKPSSCSCILTLGLSRTEKGKRCAVSHR